MVAIRKRKIGGNFYYFLGQSYREGEKVKKHEIYLGNKIPEDIERIKKEFFYTQYSKKLFEKIDKKQKRWIAEENKTPKSAKEKEQNNFAIKFTYNTQRIEGSTLTLRETANLLEHGISPKEKPIRDVTEAQAHQKVFFEMMNYKKDLDLNIVLYWHKKLFDETKKDIAGKIRTHQVAIGGSKFLPPFPAELNILLKEFFEWYNENKKRMHPVELAALVHLKFVTIHPFSDGNGRISRLLMNFVLNKKDYPMLDIPYERRSGYYSSLERSQVKKEDNIFLMWFFKKYINK